MPAGKGEWTVEMEGVDIYDPVSNTIQATDAGKVAAWFLDSDYDGRTFCITQAFFPMRLFGINWSQAEVGGGPRPLRRFSSTRSLPFGAESMDASR